MRNFMNRNSKVIEHLQKRDLIEKINGCQWSISLLHTHKYIHIYMWFLHIYLSIIMIYKISWYAAWRAILEG